MGADKIIENIEYILPVKWGRENPAHIELKQHLTIENLQDITVDTITCTNENEKTRPKI